MSDALYKKLSPFDFVSSINDTKVNLITCEEEEAQYLPFMVNRALSYFGDTILQANEMNRYHDLDKAIQYNFLLLTVSRKKRFSKWHKPEQDDRIDLLKRAYGYNTERAREALAILTEEEIKILMTRHSRGGRGK